MICCCTVQGGKQPEIQEVHSPFLYGWFMHLLQHSTLICLLLLPKCLYLSGSQRTTPYLYVAIPRGVLRTQRTLNCVRVNTLLCQSSSWGRTDDQEEHLYSFSYPKKDQQNQKENIQCDHKSLTSLSWLQASREEEEFDPEHTDHLSLYILEGLN